MENKSLTVATDSIKNSIFTIRGVQVMLDRDLGKLYQVETRVLNQAVKRNSSRFPKEFMFQLTVEELEEWKSQIVISNKEVMGIRKMPFAFNEQGVAMLSAVLHSEIAVRVSIQIIQAFVEMRKFIANNTILFQRLDKVEQKQFATDIRIQKLLNAFEDKSIKPKQGIFYDGQVFDAYLFISDLVKSAHKSILLIDNFIDESVLQLFTKRKKAVSATIYTKKISKILRQDLEKHNSQYPKIEILEFTKAHDRFLIIDETDIYHLGASLKDLGKKWFAFSKMDMKAIEMITKLNCFHFGNTSKAGCS